MDRRDEPPETPGWDAALVEEVTPGLRRVARGLLADAAAADDVVQQVWLER